MKMSELKAVLDKHNIWPHDYSINGEIKPLSECAVCIRKKNAETEIFVQERNTKSQFQRFDSEDAACRKFLSMFKIKVAD